MIFPFDNKDKVGTEAQQDLVVPPSSDRRGIKQYNEMMEQVEEEAKN